MQKENKVVKKNSVMLNLIQHLQRLPLLFINNLRGRSRIKYGMTTNLMGFTLIELLVVVLIIGILAAVAVPQYQTAADKSKVVPYIKLIWEIKRAEEVFYLANGYYTNKFQDLDVDYTTGCSRASSPNILACPSHLLIDIATGSNIATGSIVLFFCPNTSNWQSFSCEQNAIFAYSIYFDHHWKAGQINCAAYNSRADRLCKTLQ